LHQILWVETSGAIPFPGAESIFSSLCGANCAFPGFRASYDRAMEPLVRLLSVFAPMSLASFPTISIPRRSKHYSINSDYLEAFVWIALGSKLYRSAYAGDRFAQTPAIRRRRGARSSPPVSASPAYPRAMSQATTSSQLIRTLLVGSDRRFKMDARSGAFEIIDRCRARIEIREASTSRCLARDSAQD
jgi:hypothetical protein